MKHKSLILIGTVLASLFVSLVFGVQKAHATTGCFTDTIGHPFETFICWMLDNSITSGTSPGIYSPYANVTRGQMAVFMQRQAEIPPSTGPIYVNAGLDGWVKNGSGGSYTENYTDVIFLRAPGAGVYGFQITPDLPATLYGRQLLTHSVKLCYDTAPGAFLTAVYFRHYTGGSAPFVWSELIDLTDQTDATCREYVFPFDASLWGSDHISLYIQVDFAGAGDIFRIAATTFTLMPSTLTGVLAPENAFETRPEMQAPQPASGGAGSAP